MIPSILSQQMNQGLQDFLACLLRRLKARLGTPEGHLCPIGTSATLGDAESKEQLITYAQQVFGEPFDYGSVISEYRQSAEDFLHGQLIKLIDIPDSGEALSIENPDAQKLGYVVEQLGQMLPNEMEELRRNNLDELPAFLFGKISPLVTKEHTGLLERETREELERKFKAQDGIRKPWYPNLLSSVPTLEMGIDIGDLSTTMQCSVPPTQANYIQRIGRSGRKNSNGLNLTVAAGQAHDLYFFASPLRVLSGETVRMPLG